MNNNLIRPPQPGIDLSRDSGEHDAAGSHEEEQEKMHIQQVSCEMREWGMSGMIMPAASSS
jgi:hypothetical protein